MISHRLNKEIKTGPLLWGLFVLQILVVYWLPGVFGFFVLLSFLTLLVFGCGQVLEKKGCGENSGLVSILVVSSYTSITLALIYYVAGFTPILYLSWSLFTSLVVWLLVPRISFGLPDKKVFKALLSLTDYFPYTIILGSLIFLALNFLFNPVLNGSPTPWGEVGVIHFLLFFVTSLLIAYASLTRQRENWLVSLLYFIVAVGVVALMYPLSYGYDTLLHQAGLESIARDGSIAPFLPYYIGQYVQSLMLHEFTGLSFTLIERWFTPLAFIFLLIITGNLFFKRLGREKPPYIVPLVSLLMIPSVFFFSTPYAYALVWAVVSVSFVYVYSVRGHTLDLFLALLAAITSLFIHPFVGLHVLVISLGVYFFKRAKSARSKSIVLGGLFLVASLVVTLVFSVFSWLQDSQLILVDPIFHLNKFFELFSPPIWYSATLSEPSFFVLIYLFEQIHFFVILFLIFLLLLFAKKQRRSIVFLLVVIFSALVSAWLFISSIEISGYSNLDTVNYSYRLIQVGKWMAWPAMLLVYSQVYNKLTKQPGRAKYLVIAFCFAIFLTMSWYLVYPRRDIISHPGVNTTRAVDYDAVEFIYEREGGKTGYLVFANQLFGAAAIKKYGFGPYYNYQGAQVLYYSSPSSSPLHDLFTEIISSESFSIGQFNELMKEVGVTRVYFVGADYWSPSDLVKKDMKNASAGDWSIQNGAVEIFLFESL